jgi:hypothetical protein
MYVIRNIIPRAIYVLVKCSFLYLDTINRIIIKGTSGNRGCIKKALPISPLKKEI